LSGLDFNLFGGKKSKKQKKRTQLAKNQATGLGVQRLHEIGYAMQGFNVTRKKTGCDFEATRQNPYSGKKEHLYVESKSSSTAPVRPLQKKLQKKERKNFKVERGLL
jgi:hypothetical protein